MAPVNMLFIAGPHSVGKTTIARQLQDNGFLHIETGDIVRKKHQEVAPELEFHTWASGQHHKFDRFIADVILNARAQIEQSRGVLQDVLVIGNRQIGGIDYLLQNIPPLDGRPNLIIYVEADEQILFHRHVERPGRAVDGLTFEKFKEEVLGFDTRMGLEKIRDRAHLIVYNEGEMSCCVDCVAKFLESNGYHFHGRAIEGNVRNLEIR